MRCKNCGKELAKDSKFCNYCGMAIDIHKEDKTREEKKLDNRKIVYDGEIHRCPNCGDVVEAYESICDCCGFELRKKELTQSIREFIKNVNECEHAISDNPKINKGGFYSWDDGKKIVFIILTICLYGIPLAIYFLLPVIKRRVYISPEEKRLESLIENYVFPNDKASIIDALIFVKEKIEFITKKAVSRKSLYWYKLWYKKAEQLKNKADILFPNDRIINVNYEKILNIKNDTQRRMKKKAMIGGAILVIAIITISVISTIIYKNVNGYNNTIQWVDTILYNRIPRPEKENGKVKYESSSRVEIEVYDVSVMDFESYVRKCRKEGFNIDTNRSSSTYSNSLSFDGKNSDGFKIEVEYKNGILEIEINNYSVDKDLLQRLNDEKQNEQE